MQAQRNTEIIISSAAPTIIPENSTISVILYLRALCSALSLFVDFKYAPQARKTKTS
jgi:hypothetical protein